MPRARSRSVAQRVVRLQAELAQQRLRLGRVALDQLLGDAQIHGNRDELLLGAIVDVALQAPPLRILRGHDPLP